MNIIQIRNTDIHAADQAFDEFMSLTEDYLNDKTREDNSLFKTCRGHELERVALDALHEVSASTPFRKENIRLISGAKFPDIVAEQYYGVEVKSTQEDCWKSTGSSIVENTRVEDVANIYMLFGKLGGKRAEFRCLPYQDCLSSIAVTHSPRYLIDMELSAKRTPTIFDKIGVAYDEFRLLDENAKVARVRQYYKSQAQARGKIQMPWWMGDDTYSSPVLSLFSDMSLKCRDEVVVRMFILFPFDVLNGDYKRAALWMCSRYSVINPSMRDYFSAGGKVEELGGVRLPHKMPQVLRRLYRLRESIVALLQHPDAPLMQDIAYCWDDVSCYSSLLEQWLDKVNTGFQSNSEMACLDIRQLMADWR